MWVFKQKLACLILNDPFLLILHLIVQDLLSGIAIATLEVLDENISDVIALDEFVVLVLANEERGAVRAPEF